MSFDLSWKQTEDEPFVDAGEGTSVVIDHEKSIIHVGILPAMLELSITDISPDPTAEVQVFYEDRQVFADRPKIYEIPIGTLGTKELRFEITTKQGNKSEQIYTIEVSRASVKADIKVDPDFV